LSPGCHTRKSQLRGGAAINENQKTGRLPYAFWFQPLLDQAAASAKATERNRSYN